MCKYALTVIALLFAVSASAQDTPKASIFDVAPYVVTVGGNVADVITTHQAFARGGTEANPLLTSDTGSVIAMKVVSATVTITVMRYMETHGYKKAAKIVGYASGGFAFGLAAHNTRVQR